MIDDTGITGPFFFIARKKTKQCHELKCFSGK